MNNIFNYTQTTKSNGTTGPTYHPKFPITGYIIHVVDSVQQYRPDKIAYQHYGNPDLHWVLDVANNFYNGFSEYTIGTEIRVPTLDSLLQMGIIATEEL